MDLFWICIYMYHYLVWKWISNCILHIIPCIELHLILCGLNFIWYPNIISYLNPHWYFITFGIMYLLFIWYHDYIWYPYVAWFFDCDILNLLFYISCGIFIRISFWYSYLNFKFSFGILIFYIWYWSWYIIWCFLLSSSLGSLKCSSYVHLVKSIGELILLLILICISHRIYDVHAYILVSFYVSHLVHIALSFW